MIKSIDDKNLHTGHRNRLRATAKQVGLDNLPEHQALELLLSYVVPRGDVNPLAHKLIDKFGSLSAVLEADEHALQSINGIGTVVASFLHMCSEIPATYRKSKMKAKMTFFTPSSIVEYFRKYAEISANEKFYVMCLNDKSEKLNLICLGNGAINKISVNIRDLVKHILTFSTSGIVICHTHTNNLSQPSFDDMTFTKALVTSLAPMGIKVLDHIIVSPYDYFSYFNDGALADIYNSLQISTKKESLLASPTVKYTKD